MFVRLICWDEDLARERLDLLKSSGWKIDGARLNPTRFISQFKQNQPDAVLIDLDRLPSHGHAVAYTLRTSPSTRRIPIVFAGGAPEKLDRIRKELPDAVFTDWKNVARVVKKAAANPPLNPAKPVPHMQRYQGTGLVTKLGLKPNMKVAVIAPPEHFDELIGEWPESVEVEPRFTRRTELGIWFIRSSRELDSVAAILGAQIRPGISAWICYPKQSGRYKVDVTMYTVRAACLEFNLVDYKICSIDKDWSGMKFTLKKS